MKYKKMFVVFIAILGTLLLCEAGLRTAGYRPGMFRKLSGFEPVDSLILYSNYNTDEAGIYKFSPWVTDSMQLYFDHHTAAVSKAAVRANLYPVDRLDYILQSFIRLSDPTAADGIFWKVKRYFMDDEQARPSEFVQAYEKTLKGREPDAWSTSIAAYVSHPFNADGFRSIPFRPYHGKRKKILLIGDSFVFGMSARPVYNCFSDILLSRGYMLYSAGISGTDPAQYAAIAGKYIPALHPDIVIVCFYEGNDYMRFSRVPAANQPSEHITNSGFYSSNPYGVYLTAPDAYRYYLDQVRIPDSPHSFFNKICSTTALGGVLWHSAYNMHLASNGHVAYDDSIRAHTQADTAYTRDRMMYIDSICTSMGVAYLPVVIPENSARHNEHREKLIVNTTAADQIFKNKKYYYPRDLDVKVDFPKNDYHFNNTGSLKFADFLDSLIRTNFSD